jgi:hypothetical protein
MMLKNIGEIHDSNCVCSYCDTGRLLEAAEKWDTKSEIEDMLTQVEHERNELNREVERLQKIIHELTDKPSNDPDGVGEGWRLLNPGDLVSDGDEYQTIAGKWIPAGLKTRRGSKYVPVFRRRIETPVPVSPVASHVAEGQAETQPRERTDEPTRTCLGCGCPLNVVEWTYCERCSKMNAPEDKSDGELTVAAICYARIRCPHESIKASTSPAWPLDVGLWKPSKDRVENLKKARDLLNREIQGLEKPAEPQGKPREWWIVKYQMSDRAFMTPRHDGVHVREVNAEMDAWTARLIELCEAIVGYTGSHTKSEAVLINDMCEHMEARPQ